MQILLSLPNPNPTFFAVALDVDHRSRVLLSLNQFCNWCSSRISRIDLGNNGDACSSSNLAGRGGSDQAGKSQLHGPADPNSLRRNPPGSPNYGKSEGFFRSHGRVKQEVAARCNEL
ncbi:hypothetical protein L6452_08353 [Arctium lappa]|uniref:Uncharacterized protein n=1 Tax=Arctium lappa TaxID=4217 RepID=A0ACB9DHJ1_ARCLA|nr:hypothetical protein L6452_08353 [Arctium lappa]